MNRTSLLALAALLAVTVAYGVGHRHGAHARDQQAHRVIRDTIRLVEERVRADTVRIRIAAAKADVARDTARAELARVDSLVAAAALPDTLVMPAVTACRSALDADSVVIAELRITVDDALHYGALEQRRAELAEHELARRSRFGLKSGAVIGAVVVSVLHALLK